jgi:hypothetical protein
MYDDNNTEDTSDATPSYDDISQTEAAGIAEAFNQNDGDQTGFLANFIHDQPVLTLSLAFGLGLLATSLLARKRT